MYKLRKEQKDYVDLEMGQAQMYSGLNQAEIAEYVKNLIIYTGLTQAEFAKRMGVSLATLSRYATGKGRLKNETVRRIYEFAIDWKQNKQTGQGFERDLDPSEYAEYITTMMESAGVTPRQLGMDLGTDTIIIKRYMMGQLKPSSKTLEKIRAYVREYQKEKRD